MSDHDQVYLENFSSYNNTNHGPINGRPVNGSQTVQSHGRCYKVCCCPCALISTIVAAAFTFLAACWNCIMSLLCGNKAVYIPIDELPMDEPSKSIIVFNDLQTGTPSQTDVGSSTSSSSTSNPSENDSEVKKTDENNETGEQDFNLYGPYSNEYTLSVFPNLNTINSRIEYGSSSSSRSASNVQKIKNLLSSNIEVDKIVDNSSSNSAENQGKGEQDFNLNEGEVNDSHVIPPLNGFNTSIEYSASLSAVSSTNTSPFTIDLKDSNENFVNQSPKTTPSKNAMRKLQRKYISPNNSSSTISTSFDGVETPTAGKNQRTYEVV